MNTNPNAIKILCYGDSNTWGAKPEDDSRYPADVRWTGILQQKLGNMYYIIEEGLGGRTTSLDEEGKEYRNGKTYFYPCLDSHSPLDLVIITLGTNDVKTTFNKTPEEIAGGMEELLQVVRDHADQNSLKAPKIIIVSPAPVDETKWTDDDKFVGGTEKSKELAVLYEKLANSHKCGFVDLGKYIKVDPHDGVHLSAESHAKIAEVLCQKIKDL